MNKKKVDKVVLCVGIVCITALEICALLLGYNGTLLKGVLVVIALAIGITIPTNIVKILLKGGK